LLSAYRAESHAAWADWLVATQTQYYWQRFELPGRHFSWRIRGNPLSWLDLLPAHAPALIVATSMVDLATLKGLLPRLARVPALYYFHENQFAYPRSELQTTSVESQMVQLYGALAAQRILFNSRFNKESFLRGVDELMQKMPDAVPAALAARLEAKSGICPVPIVPVPVSDARDARLVVWNHRWSMTRPPICLPMPSSRHMSSAWSSGSRCWVVVRARSRRRCCDCANTWVTGLSRMAGWIRKPIDACWGVPRSW
jgi:hypothetical protein